MEFWSKIGKSLGGLGGIAGSLTGGISSMFTGGADSTADVLDPGNIFHQGAAEREANRQWQLEYELSKQNYENQEKWNDLNYKHQIEAYNYQKELNSLQMEREDTAVQRRVADLKAAGLSPTLAAGSAANATPVHAGTAPQGTAPQQEAPSDIRARAAMFAQEQKKDMMQLAVSTLGNMSDISRTFAEKKLLEQQRATQDAQRHLYESQAEGQDIQNRYMDDFLSGRNYNQDLQNYQLELKNSLDEQLNDIKVEQGLKDLRQSDIDYDLSVMQKVINDNAILIQNEEIVAKKLQNKLAEEGYEYDLEDKRLRTAAAAITLEQLEVDLAETKRVNGLYKELDPELPPHVIDKVTGGHLFQTAYPVGSSVIHIAKRICQGFGWVARTVVKPFTRSGPRVKYMPLQE